MLLYRKKHILILAPCVECQSASCRTDWGNQAEEKSKTALLRRAQTTRTLKTGGTSAGSGVNVRHPVLLGWRDENACTTSGLRGLLRGDYTDRDWLVKVWELDGPRGASKIVCFTLPGETDFRER
jgi:hypothetical protein